MDDITNELIKVNFIIDGLENNEPFKRFLGLFEEQAIMADSTWQNCLVEDDKGRTLFYQLRSNKLSVVNILNKLEELKSEKLNLQDELTELQSE